MIDINKIAELYVEMMDSEFNCETLYAEQKLRPMLNKNNWDVVPVGKDFKLVSLRTV